MKHWHSIVLSTLTFVALPSVAAAHVVMTSPGPRSNDNGLTTEPCGGVPPGPVLALTAGDTITVSWDVSQPHDGTIRVDFAEADDAGFDQHVLATDLADPGGPGSVEVTLPDVNCDPCTLRVIQVNPAEDYVSCADVALSGAAAGTTGADSTGAATGSDGGTAVATDSGNDSSAQTTGGGDTGAGATTGGAGSATAGGSASAGGDASAGSGGSDTTGQGADDDDSSGCSCRADGPHGSTWLLLGVLALVCRRRASMRIIPCSRT